MTSTTSILIAWKPRRLYTTSVVVIPKRHIILALATLAHSIVAAPNAPPEASSSDSE
jgi:hypothetical protein